MEYVEADTVPTTSNEDNDPNGEKNQPENEDNDSECHEENVMLEEDSNEVEHSEEKSSEDDSENEDSDSDAAPNSSDTASQENGDKIRSRELKSLIAAAKESNLDTNIDYKRKSLSDSIDGRRSSSSADLDVSMAKRNMRSQNPDFVAKHHKFISKVASELELSEPNTDDESIDLAGKRKWDSLGNPSSFEEKRPRKLAKTEIYPMKADKDRYCWQCHKEEVQIQCMACPRSYHLRCLRNAMPICENWICTECVAIDNAENPGTKSIAMKRLNQSKINLVLNFALQRMLSVQGSEPFQKAVDTKELTDYRNYVIHPMDLSQLKQKIDSNSYLSTESFIADAKWILHNSILYNSSQSKLTSAAKSIIKTCKLETAEIETCPECYINANTKKDTWFIEVCSKPHILVWAKLKGFPFWPAKAVNWLDSGVVDVRFFGAHDKAWVPVRDVYLYSDKDPNVATKHQKNNIAESIREVDLHIEKLISCYGKFKYAPFKTPFEPENEIAQLQLLLPNYQPNKFHTYANKAIKFTAKRTPKKIFIMRQSKENSENTEAKKSLNMSSESEMTEDCGTEDESLNQSHGDFDKSEPENGIPSKTSTPSRSNIPIKLRISLDESKKKRIPQSPNKNDEGSENKFPRRDSDVSSKSSKSDISRVSDKINRVEFSESTEVMLGNISSIEAKNDEKKEIVSKLKPVIEVNPVELINTNKEIRISPQGKLVTTSAEKPVDSVEEMRLKVSSHLRFVIGKSLNNLEKPSSTTSSTKPTSDSVNCTTESEVEPDSISKSNNNISKSENESKKSKKEVTLVDVSKIIHGSNVSSPKPKNKTPEKVQTSQPHVIVQQKPEIKKINKTPEKSNKKPPEPNSKPTPLKIRPVDTKSLIDPAHIKEEILDSDEEPTNAEHVSRSEFFPALNLSPNVSLSVVEKLATEKRKPIENAASNKPSNDNISRIIEDVAKGDIGETLMKKSELKVISVAEINQKKHLEKSTNSNSCISNNSKQPRARKSFPRSSQTFINPKKINADRQLGKSDNTVSSKPSETKPAEVQKDKMLYIPHSTPITLLQPNMSFNTMTNTSSNIFTMISQSGGQQKMSVCIPQTLFNSGGKSLPLIPLTTTPTSTTSTPVVQPRIDEERNSLVGLPPLKPRPSGPLSRESVDSLPSNLGPVTQILNRSSQQLADYFRNVILETLNDISGMGCLETKIKEYQLDLEAQKQKYVAEINALKLEIASLKQSHAADRQRIIQETRQACDQERIRAIEEVKAKQWCANCYKESQYRCCWSTSYCSYSCQRTHWEKHKSSCEQANENQKKDSSSSTSEESSLTTVIRPKAKNKTPKNSSNNSNHSNKNTVSILTSKANSSTVPTLTFVQNNTGGIELLGNPGPIQLGGKLITASAFPSKIKGYIVSSSSTTPNITNLANKSTMNPTVNSNKMSTHNKSDVMEVDDDDT